MFPPDSAAHPRSTVRGASQTSMRNGIVIDPPVSVDPPFLSAVACVPAIGAGENGLNLVALDATTTISLRAGFVQGGGPLATWKPSPRRKCRPRLLSKIGRASCRERV